MKTEEIRELVKKEISISIKEILDKAFRKELAHLFVAVFLGGVMSLGGQLIYHYITTEEGPRIYIGADYEIGTFLITAKNEGDTAEIVAFGYKDEKLNYNNLNLEDNYIKFFFKEKEINLNISVDYNEIGLHFLRNSKVNITNSTFSFYTKVELYAECANCEEDSIKVEQSSMAKEKVECVILSKDRVNCTSHFFSQW